MTMQQNSPNAKYDPQLYPSIIRVPQSSTIALLSGDPRRVRERGHLSGKSIRIRNRL
jgi:hypothetical protein